jgi:hypothetical protein
MQRSAQEVAEVLARLAEEALAEEEDEGALDLEVEVALDLEDEEEEEVVEAHAVAQVLPAQALSSPLQERKWPSIKSQFINVSTKK